MLSFTNLSNTREKLSAQEFLTPQYSKGKHSENTTPYPQFLALDKMLEGAIRPAIRRISWNFFTEMIGRSSPSFISLLKVFTPYSKTTGCKSYGTIDPKSLPVMKKQKLRLSLRDFVNTEL